MLLQRWKLSARDDQPPRPPKRSPKPFDLLKELSS
jgi:hypothetical protein